MPESVALLGIGAALVMGAISPGPSFVMVARIAIGASRTHGLFAALGMGVGGALFATAALFGLQGLLLTVPSLYLVLKIAGGLYLLYLGVRLWITAAQPLAAGEGAASSGIAAVRSFATGLATQTSNPKTAIVYASVFAAFLPTTPSVSFSMTVVALVFCIEVAWYALVAIALSSSHPRGLYLRYKAWVDRAAGSAMIALGLKLVWGAKN